MLDENFYRKYEDLNILNDNELLNHWNGFGIIEKRIPSLKYFYNEYPNFDWLKYIKYNNDIGITEFEAITHFYKHGYMENRKVLDLYKLIKYEIQIKYDNCIMVNINNINIYNKIKKKIKTLKNKFNVIIISSDKKIIKKCKKNYEIILKINDVEHENYGELCVYNFLYENKIDFNWILKIHTNKNILWTNDLINPLFDENVINYLSLNNQNNQNQIKMFASYECKSYINDYEMEINDILKFLNINEKITTKTFEPLQNEYIYNLCNIDIKYSSEISNNKIYNISNFEEITNNYSYVNGSMYWIDYNFIKKYNNLINYIVLKNNNYLINFDKIIAILIQITNNEILYLKNNKYNKHILFEQQTNNEILQKYNKNIYLKYNGDLIQLNDDELYKHFLNFGIDERRIYSFEQIYIPKKNNDEFNYYDNNKDNNCLLYNKILNYDNYITNNIITNYNENIIDNINNYTIIIDFYNFGGGTEHFLNLMLNNYKNNVFIIIRYNKGNYYIYINKMIINKIYSFDEIKNIINKSNKIIINSIYKYKDEFINFIKDKNKIIITHDYSFISKIPNPYYREIIPDNIKNNCINENDIFITQNYYNIPLINKFMKLNNEFNIIDLPDYKNADKLIKTNNKKIKIIFIGVITEKKGLFLVEQIYQKYNLLYDFFVIGNIETDLPIQYQSYKSITEFNNILKIVKPNIIIFPALWPETYSYCLSLAIITTLPILCYDIGKCVVNNRLEKYKNYELFENINDLKILIENKKQNEFYLIKDEIYVPIFWDTIFKNNKQLYFENIILITSNTSNKNISSSMVNDIINKIINSIKNINNIPNKLIILVENNNVIIDKIKTYVDIILNINNELINNCFSEIFVELYKIKEGINFINNFKFKNLFKIFEKLENEINYLEYNNDNNILIKNNNSNKICYDTNLYKINYYYFDNFMNNINNFFINNIENKFNHNEYEDIIINLIDEFVEK
jgi:hypothetical protein